MCGIAGFAYFNTEQPASLELLQQMTACLARRGPDGEGFWTEGPIALSHRRLSIIDLSERGTQPMHSADGRLHVTFNGEIYNFPTLRGQLEQAGFSFVSGTDTEVLLHGYRYWGLSGLLERIKGMFAFVLYDGATRQLHFVRDRLGKKPLLYCVQPEGIYFGSDLRCLLATGKSFKLNYESLDYYLTEVCMPQPNSIWQGIQQIPPAHSMTVELATGRQTLHRYWQLDFSQPKLNMTEAEALEETERLFEVAVDVRQISDVPLGAFLSGGVDSGLVVAMLARKSSTPVKTFSVGFGFSPFNELPDAKRVAERYCTDHTELILEPDVLRELPDIVAEFGEPFADQSALPTMLICRAIRGKVTVALSGDGGDELYGGYYEYPRAWQADKYPFLAGGKDGLTPLAWRGVSKFLRTFGIGDLPAAYVQEWEKRSPAGKLYRHIGYAPENRNWVHWPLAITKNGEQVLSDAWNHAQGQDELTRLFDASMRQRLLNDYLVKVDRASMMCGLEVRSPFLDTDLASFAAQIPNHLKLKGGEPKYLLKKLSEKLVDSEVFTRKKRGFSLPLAEWLRGDLREPVRELLQENPFAQAGIFDAKYIDSIWNIHQSRKFDHSNRIWLLACLTQWYRTFKPSLS
jgi:asparagine synthase (glutamine-hydrolysing)